MSLQTLEKSVNDIACMKGGTNEKWSMVMATAKDEMIAILQDQPDDSSFEELMRELVFNRMVDQGLKESREGRTMSHEKMLRKAMSWKK